MGNPFTEFKNALKKVLVNNLKAFLGWEMDLSI